MSSTSFSPIINPLDNPLHPNLKFLDDLEIPEIENRSESTEESANTEFHHWTSNEVKDVVAIFLRTKSFQNTQTEFNHKHHLNKSTKVYRLLIDRIIKKPTDYDIQDQVEQLENVFQEVTRHHWTQEETQNFVTIFLKKKNISNAIKEFNCKHFFKVNHRAYYFLVKRVIKEPKNYGIEDNKVQQLKEAMQKISRKGLSKN